MQVTRTLSHGKPAAKWRSARRQRSPNMDINPDHTCAHQARKT